jgi:hypothetical protein
MSILDDLQQLKFGQGIADSINKISETIYVGKLQSALEEEKAQATEPTAARDLLQNAQDKTGLPETSASLLPQLQTQLDATMKRIQRRSDIYGKFIPAIAMLNPDLAASIVREQIQSENVLEKPLHEKIALAEFGVRQEQVKETRLEREQAAKDRLEYNREALYARLQQSKEVAGARLDESSRYHSAQMQEWENRRQSTGLSTTKEFNTLNSIWEKSMNGIRQSRKEFDRTNKQLQLLKSPSGASVPPVERESQIDTLQAQLNGVTEDIATYQNKIHDVQGQIDAIHNKSLVNAPRQGTLESPIVIIGVNSETGNKFTPAKVSSLVEQLKAKGASETEALEHLRKLKIIQ